MFEGIGLEELFWMFAFRLDSGKAMPRAKSRTSTSAMPTAFGSWSIATHPLSKISAALHNQLAIILLGCHRSFRLRTSVSRLPSSDPGLRSSNFPRYPSITPSNKPFAASTTSPTSLNTPFPPSEWVTQTT